MRAVYRRAAALSLCLCVLLPQGKALSLAEMPAVSARSAVLLEASTGKLLCAKNAHERLPMASTTKIMTAIVALENCALEENVKVSAQAYGTEGSSMYLELGEVLSMEDLLYGLMIASGNDAAVAIAEHAGGSVEGFAAMMNDKAAQLGLANTHFVTPNGLHDEAHYTTAYELALTAAYAMQNETFRSIVATRDYTTKTGNKTRTLHAKNKTLYLYEGGNGVKTGYTSLAGRCLVFSAEREGMQLVGAVLKSGDTYGDAFALLDYGFSQYEMYPVLRAGDTVRYARLRGAQKNTLALLAQRDIMIPVEKGALPNCRIRLSGEGEMEAPIEAGDGCGSVQIWENGRMLAQSGLVAASSVGKNSLWDYWKRCASDWSA